VSRVEISPVLQLADLHAAALASIASRGGEVFLEHRDSLTLRLESGALDSKGDRDVGAGIRFGGGGPLGFVSTNVVDVAGLTDAARVAESAAGNSSPVSDRRATLELVGHVTRTHHPRVPVDSVATDVKADLLREIVEAARAVDPRIRRVSVTYVDVVQHVAIVTKQRELVPDVRTRTRVTCRVVARDADSQGSGFDGPGTGGGFELFDEYPAATIGATAARRALQNLTGVDRESRTCQVVLGPSAGGMLVHEACGHGLEADLLGRDSSVFSRSRGKRVAAPAVTIVDDPALAAGFGSYGIDDEGNAARRCVLIAGGIQVAEMTDSVAAAKLGVARSANGRRESYAHAPMPRMSNTYLDGGTDEASAIIADVVDGVYVARLSAGEVDTATGDFTFSASEAFEITAGQLGRPLRGVTLIGNSFQALDAIDAVAADLAFTQAMCGKDDQWVPISYGSPTVRIGSLTVTGR
jgi:TldD protein